jgi:hypothetical protein
VRASVSQLESALNVSREVMSYTNSAPGVDFTNQFRPEFLVAIFLDGNILLPLNSFFRTITEKKDCELSFILTKLPQHTL